MNHKKYTEGQSLSPEELEAISEELIQAKFDREKKTKWSQQLKEQYGVEKQPAKTKYRFLFSKVAIAAILVCVAGIVASVILFSKPSYETVLNESIENLVTIDNQAIVTRGNEVEKTQMVAALEAYNNKKYDESIRIWQQLVALGENKGTAEYNLALCYLQKEPVELAVVIKNLKIAVQTKTVQPEANWALALAYLKANQKEAATEILQEIIRAKAYKYKKAAQFIELL
ncbi:type III secretion low calcium response chaperone LcrH/SycD [Kordia sp. SMS9]|uniref:tetratricopeptide repeat protein n=1 Tax=Kordia sp. SMS9 TaxID=2282170 RepID=UPI000E0D055F|nr:hypothetical protein [Kordia sp. SMS9]AXG71588.1 type III secretion low calcium response chaperone LcrH/SycD [Kordia sp. SMS9]